jgi:hypothetical protein
MAEPVASRIAVRVLKWAVQLYPPEKRAWGEAFVAEADSAAEFGGALSWMIGGLMVAFRALLSNLVSKLFRRDPKVEPAFFGPGAIRPVPWKLALTCLAIFGALLFVPPMRQALGTVAFTWKEAFKPARLKTYRHTPDEAVRWERLGHEAEARGDAPAMVFAAMRLADPGKDFEEAVRLDEVAVARDRSLTWTYYFLAPPAGFRHFTGSPHPELLEELRQWDPSNALPLVATAEDAVWDRQASGFPLPREQTHERYLADAERFGPEWRQWMDRAFAAPAYIDYAGRRLELDRRVMRQLSINDPTVALAEGYLRQPNLYFLHAYAEVRLAQGEEYEHVGKLDQAASQYWAVAGFSQRMRLRPDRELAQWDNIDMTGAGLESEAFERLHTVLLKLGRTEEAQVVDAAGREAWRNMIGAHQSGSYFLNWSSALWVHVWALLTIFSGLLTVIALFRFAVGNSASPFVRFALSYTSLLLVLSCAGLLAAYHPYTEGFYRYLNDPRGGGVGTAVSDSMSLGELNGLFEVPMGLQWWVWANGKMLFWWALIATVGAACVWLVSRSLRHRHV